MDHRLAECAQEIRGFIDKSLDGAVDQPAREAEFSRLAVELFHVQFDLNETYRRFCRGRGAWPDNVETWQRIPCIPASAFKGSNFTCLPPKERTACFVSSGTTRDVRGRHFHSSTTLEVYEASLARWFEHGQIEPLRTSTRPAPSGFRWISLTPPAADAPDSSLVHMFDVLSQRDWVTSATFVGRADPRQRRHTAAAPLSPPLPRRNATLSHGEKPSPGRVDRAGEGAGWQVDVDALVAAVAEANATSTPVFLVGTAFSFVHLLEALDSRELTLPLPHGSRLLETGGYKGRSRVLAKSELRRWMASVFHVPQPHLVGEYGMSELSSQAYDNLGADPVHPGSRSFRFPPWARVRIISPETGEEVGVGEEGLVCVTDLANVGSALALQTEDLAIRRAEGFELTTRQPGAERRGCSLMAAH